MSSIVGAKAISLLHSDGVEEKGFARVFKVRGTTRTYVVTVLEGERLCNCPAGQAGRRCYHAAAVALYMARARDAARLEGHPVAGA